MSRCFPGRSGPAGQPSRRQMLLVAACFSLRVLQASDDPPPVGLPRRLDGHSDNIYTLLADPQGHWFASVSEDATIRIWKWPSGKLHHRLRGEDAFYDAVISPRHRQLLACDGGGRLHRFDPDTGRALQSWKSHDTPVYALALHPDGQSLAAGGGEQEPVVRLWTVHQPRCLRTLKGHTDSVYGLSFSPDGRFLASSSADRSVRLWSCADGRLRHTLVHDNYVYRCRFAPHGPLLATACHDKRLRLWNAETGQCLTTFAEARGPLFTVAFTPDGRYLLAAGEDRTVRVYDVERLRFLAAVPVAKDVIYTVTLLPGNPPVLAAAGGDSRVHLLTWQPHAASPPNAP